MKIVIDIDEKYYYQAKAGKFCITYFDEAIKNGTPLPKGHKIIDQYELQEHLALEQEPRKGHWIKRHDNVGWWYVCDKCGSTPLWDENTSEVVLSPYCPNCGADMRADRSEEDGNEK